VLCLLFAEGGSPETEVDESGAITARNIDLGIGGVGCLPMVIVYVYVCVYVCVCVCVCVCVF